MASLDIIERSDGVLLKVHLVPGASSNTIAGRFGDAVKVSVKAPAVEGAANKALVETLARLLGVKKRQVEIVLGHTSRDKLVFVGEVSALEVRQRLGIDSEDS